MILEMLNEHQLSNTAACIGASHPDHKPLIVQCADEVRAIKGAGIAPSVSPSNSGMCSAIALLQRTSLVLTDSGIAASNTVE
jgi:hypothetical protein